jgi:hypothetical protein
MWCTLSTPAWGISPVADQPDALERMRDVLRETILEGHLEKHEMEQKAIEKALDQSEKSESHHRQAHTDAHLAHEKIHEVAAAAHSNQHVAEQRAIDVAVAAMDKRLDTMNGVWSQYRDAVGSFVSKEVFDARFRELEKQVGAERDARREGEGIKKGMSQSTAIIVGVVGFAVTVLGGVVILVNVLTGTP